MLEYFRVVVGLGFFDKRFVAVDSSKYLLEALPESVYVQ